MEKDEIETLKLLFNSTVFKINTIIKSIYPRWNETYNHISGFDMITDSEYVEDSIEVVVRRIGETKGDSVLIDMKLLSVSCYDDYYIEEGVVTLLPTEIIEFKKIFISNNVGKLYRWVDTHETLVDISKMDNMELLSKYRMYHKLEHHYGQTYSFQIIQHSYVCFRLGIDI